MRLITNLPGHRLKSGQTKSINILTAGVVLMIWVYHPLEVYLQDENSTSYFTKASSSSD